MAGGDEQPEGAAGEEVNEAKQQQDVERQKRAKQDLDFFYGGRRLVEINSKLMSMAPGMVLQMGMAVQKIVAVSHQVVQDCLHQDALQALDKAAQHVQSVQYVSGHLVANGQDIVRELADAIVAYKARDFGKFGTDLGTALRKVFLGTATGQGVALPEGLPDEEVVSNVTQGLLKGFFGEGSELRLTVPGDVDREPEVIEIDLHECIGNNMVFFQSIWAEVMWVYAKRSAKVKTKEMGQWSTAVALTMMQLPKALDKCSMGPEEQQMLEDAIKGLASGNDGVSWDFRLPDSARVSNDRLEKHLAITVEDWADKRWTAFGEALGKLLQEMALTMFDRKYSFEGGLLQKSLLGLSSGEPRNTPAAACLSLGMALAVGISFAAARCRSADRGEVVDFGFEVEESAVE